MFLGKLTKRFETKSCPCQSKIQPERPDGDFLKLVGAASSSGCSAIAMRHMTMLTMPRSLPVDDIAHGITGKINAAAAYVLACRC